MNDLLEPSKVQFLSSLELILRSDYMWLLLALLGLCVSCYILVSQQFLLACSCKWQHYNSVQLYSLEAISLRHGRQSLFSIFTVLFHIFFLQNSGS